MTVTSQLRLSATVLFAVFVVLAFSPGLIAQEDASFIDRSVDDSDNLVLSETEEDDFDRYRPNDLPVGTAATLPRNLSPWGMFRNADWVVKTVMIGLMLASILTWTAWLSKSIELWSMKRLIKRNFAALRSVHTLTEAANRDAVTGIGKELITVAGNELQESADISDKSGIKERVTVSLSRLEAAHARRMVKGTGLLATVGAVAPFVGLFGTVWGIMNSFIGISKAQTTNLAVVAPGIAEALLATALGLFAAIPAVIIYNYFARQIAGTKALLSDVTATVLNLVSRDLDRQSISNLK